MHCRYVYEDIRQGTIDLDSLVTELALACNAMTFRFDTDAGCFEVDITQVTGSQE